MFNVAVHLQFFSFCQQNLARLKDDSTLSFIAYLFFSLICFAPCEIFCAKVYFTYVELVRCGPLLIYVNVDNQTEKWKITRTTHWNQDIDIYVEECKFYKYLLNVGHLPRPQCVVGQSSSCCESNSRYTKRYQQIWRYYNHISVLMSLTNSYLTTCAYALALRRASLTSALALLFVISSICQQILVLGCDKPWSGWSQIKPCHAGPEKDPTCTFQQCCWHVPGHLQRMLNLIHDWVYFTCIF